MTVQHPRPTQVTGNGSMVAPMRRLSVLALTVMLTLIAAGCSSSKSQASAAGNLAKRGPYSVGITTLDLGSAGKLGERFATVFYPANPKQLSGHPRFSYELTSPLPQAVAAIVPPKFNSTITVDAYVNAPADRSGPFPIVLFSHGFGASRLFYSNLLTGIASWGFVVVSADYLERGLLAQATHSTVPDTPSLDLQTMFSSLTATEKGSSSSSSPLFGVANPNEIAAVGHSAGGQTAFDALNDPRVKMAVGWAPVGPSGPPSHKPVMIIGEQEDIALTPKTLTDEFHKFPGPTTFIEVSNEGHNTYTDLCTPIRQGGGGLVGFATSLHLISGQLAQLAINGCTSKNIPPQRFWPIVQYYTVGALRSGLRIDHAVSPGPASPHQFPGFTITFKKHS